MLTDLVDNLAKSLTGENLKLGPRSVGEENFMCFSPNFLVPTNLTTASALCLSAA